MNPLNNNCKLDYLDSDNMMHGKVAFAFVNKWMRKIKFFDKDYEFILVNQRCNFHLLFSCFDS